MTDTGINTTIRLIISSSESESDNQDLILENKREIFLGRSPSTDVPLQNPAVSGVHARIVLEDREFFIEDLNSRNGTILNGERLLPKQKKLLRSGDVIKIHPFTIQFFNGLAVYEQSPPSESTSVIREDMLRNVLGGLFGAEDNPPKLIVISGQASVEQFELKGIHVEFKLGRAPHCDLVIHDENVSREHALIRRDPTGVFIRDLNSRNGVYINGQRITRNQEYRLNDRDEISLGIVTLLFSDPAGAEISKKVEEVVSPELDQPKVSVPPPATPPPDTEAAESPDGFGESGEQQMAGEGEPEGDTSPAEAQGDSEEGEGGEAQAEGEGAEATPSDSGLTTTHIAIIVSVVVLVIAVVLLLILM